MPSDVFETITTTSAMPLSRAVWRRFRREIPGLVERVLRDNPGLAEAGPVLPAGTTFRLYVPPASGETRRVEIVRLTGGSA